MSLRPIDEQIALELRDTPAPKREMPDALVVANATMAAFIRNGLEIDERDDNLRVIWPGVYATGMRFRNIFVASSTHNFITRGNPSGNTWWREQVQTRVASDGKIIILP